MDVHAFTMTTEKCPMKIQLLAVVVIVLTQITNLNLSVMNYQESLTIKELQSLKGGEDVNNSNTFNGCICFYNDVSVITNSNQIAGCQCQCTKPMPKLD
jgi:hypothetical protein